MSSESSTYTVHLPTGDALTGLTRDQAVNTLADHPYGKLEVESATFDVAEAQEVLDMQRDVITIRKMLDSEEA